MSARSPGSAGMMARPRALLSQRLTGWRVVVSRLHDQERKRPFDTEATALTVSGVSDVHAAYLASGGQDSIIDSALR
jgi:hypothetical protein